MGPNRIASKIMQGPAKTVVSERGRLAEPLVARELRRSDTIFLTLTGNGLVPPSKRSALRTECQGTKCTWHGHRCQGPVLQVWIWTVVAGLSRSCRPANSCGRTSLWTGEKAFLAPPPPAASAEAGATTPPPRRGVRSGAKIAGGHQMFYTLSQGAPRWIRRTR